METDSSVVYRSELSKKEILIKDDQLTMNERWHNIHLWLYNPRYREVCGRDALEWAKMALSYFVLFLSMAGIFALFTGIFMAIIDKLIPPYRGNSSVFAFDTLRLNLGKMNKFSLYL